MPRLDRHISAHTGVPRRDVRLMLAQGRVTVDGRPARDIAQPLTRFSRVLLDGVPTQNNTPRYLMLHKPRGVVCATKDAKHPTVVDLLHQSFRHELHIVGRLDFNSTGLVLLTNDGRWSRKLSLPSSRLIKRYRVSTEQRITREQVDAFEQGMYFSYEGITTLPAQLRLLGDRQAQVELLEGRYHQIKRMFGRFDNRVLSIHRLAVGAYALGDLAPGECADVDPQTYRL